MPNPNIGQRGPKPEKPSEDFPLFPHASGRWAKKVRGKTRYFGPWNDPDGAFRQWLLEKDALLAGEQPDKTGRKERGRPPNKEKPRPDFPLFPHASGRWAKKIGGKLKYFGKVSDDPAGKAALNLWLDEQDEWLAGRNPRLKTTGLLVVDLCDKFLVYKQDLLNAGELSRRTFDGYKQITDLLVEFFGKSRTVEDLKAADFQTLRARMAKNWGPVRLGNSIQLVRSVFKYGYDSELLEKPVRFGLFKKPTAKVMRKNRTSNGQQMFTQKQFEATLAAATPNIRAMMLLGLNGGLGNTDVAELTPEAFDFAGGWLDYPRAKTGMPRRIPLWPETIEAVQAVLEDRPAGTELLFVGKRGKTYADAKHGYRVHQEFKRVLKAAKVVGRTFYDLRRTFQTEGEGAHDLTAVQAIMGHAPPSGDMSAIYRQRVDDDRLRAVADCVHAWAFPPKKTAKQ